MIRIDWYERDMSEDALNWPSRRARSRSISNNSMSTIIYCSGYRCRSTTASTGGRPAADAKEALAAIVMVF